MEIDAAKGTSDENVVKVNGLPKDARGKKSGAAEMTSADYYFDSYAHFGKKYTFIESIKLISL